ncbi:MAG: hypothetical protein K1X72_23355 [Pyrinomonadaceae bacterium]|nr:hypothetical protein [Pyrinomonadaceae bacterium]
MTAQDFQDRLDALVLDLQTKGKGKSVNIMFRDAGNEPYVLPLSSDANGVVNAAELANVQGFVNNMKNFATQYINDTAAYTAKAAELKVIAESPAYIAARETYKNNNVSENYTELQDAKGAYVA